MRLPEFTAAVTLSTPMTSSHRGGTVLPSSAQVTPAFIPNCLFTCRASGADNCGEFCACVNSGRPLNHCAFLS
jgi:hypothetical protein